MGGGELSGKPYEMLGGGGTLAMNWHFIQGRVAPSRGGGGGGGGGRRAIGSNLFFSF